MFRVLYARPASKVDSKMAHTIKLALVLILAVSSVGCRNNRCGGYGTAGGGLFQPVATTVPSPSTYSLQGIPHTARQQDYYTIPNTGQNSVLQPSGSPTPLNTNANPNLSPQGWRQVLPGNSNTQLNNGQQQNPTSLFVNNQNGGNFATASQVNPNYRTTVTDERQDPSRLAVTDASAVRAPARFFQTGSANRLSQTPVATNAPAVPSPNQIATYTQPPTSPTQINGSVVYQGGQPNLVANDPYVSSQYGTNPYAANTYNQQARVYNPPVTSSAPTVLAQSTTERTASNVQAGWRNSQIPNVNR